MGYDYSLGFLARHQETVQKLIQIAQSGDILAYDSETWEPIRQKHQLIRSLLANMEKNMQGFEDIRRTIRTWTEHTPKGFRLNVGKPSHRVTGRTPAPLGTEWKTAYVRPEIATGQYIHPDKIAGDKDLENFYGQVYALPPTVKVARAAFVDMVDVEAAAAMIGQPMDHVGWIATVEPKELIMSRSE